jgi:hypothetical protein
MCVMIVTYCAALTYCRSSTPLVLSFFDWLFLGRELPGGRSVISIFLLIVSCGGYTWHDAGFKLEVGMLGCTVQRQ